MDSFKWQKEKSWTTELPYTGWHHTEVLTKDGVERAHFTHEPTGNHHYLKTDDQLRYSTSPSSGSALIPRRMNNTPY